MTLNAFLPRRACLVAGAACLALLLGGCFDSGGSSDDAAVETPIVTPPSTPSADPADVCDCSVKQRSCAP